MVENVWSVVSLIGVLGFLGVVVGVVCLLRLGIPCRFCSVRSMGM